MPELYVKSWDEEMKNTLYLDSLHIKDEYKGKGVGTKIINHLKEYARGKGYKGVSVSIICGNDRARNLYTKLGVVHLNDYNNYETKCEKLYWKLFQGEGNMLGNLSLFNIMGKKSPTFIGGAMNCPIVF